MSKPPTTETSPRIASYKVSAGTWALGAVILGAAALVRLIDDTNLRQIAGLAIFAVFLINALNFVIPLAKPNSILGGAKLKTLALALFALLGWVSIH
jgi:hypothetical protein